jgi:hypothetical protein
MMVKTIIQIANREELQEQNDALARAKVFHQNVSKKRQYEEPQI